MTDTQLDPTTDAVRLVRSLHANDRTGYASIVDDYVTGKRTVELANLVHALGYLASNALTHEGDPQKFLDEAESAGIAGLNRRR